MTSPDTISGTHRVTCGVVYLAVATVASTAGDVRRVSHSGYPLD
jgi:hypothetical protein